MSSEVFLYTWSLRQVLAVCFILSSLKLGCADSSCTGWRLVLPGSTTIKSQLFTTQSIALANLVEFLCSSKCCLIKGHSPLEIIGVCSMSELLGRLTWIAFVEQWQNYSLFQESPDHVTWMIFAIMVIHYTCSFLKHRLEPVHIALHCEVELHVVINKLQSV